MKLPAPLIHAGLILVVATTSASAQDPTANAAATKDSGRSWNPTSGVPNTGGETIATATVISSLPYTDSDNTCGHVHDYTARCGANAAPDLFYRYVPPSDQTALISLCGSAYDTVLYVLENGVEIACNDDFCGLDSELRVPLVAGRTYTIGVSGFRSNCGSYILHISELPDCYYECPLPAQIEYEPRCGPGYVDHFNGGCNSTPAVFSGVYCYNICGETGTFTVGGAETPDTDWYRLTVFPGNFSFS